MWNNQWWVRYKVIYLCKVRVSQSKIMNLSEKQERERERAKEKQCLYKSYTVKGDVWVKQHEKGDHIVIKSLKDIDKI